jgi:hypothetical protein
LPDLKFPRLIILKGFLFLFLGCLAAWLIIAELPTFKLVVLLGLTIWSFCRFYYFAFYVIEHYVDPTYKFSGLISVARYLMGQRSAR